MWKSCLDLSSALFINLTLESIIKTSLGLKVEPLNPTGTWEDVTDGQTDILTEYCNPLCMHAEEPNALKNWLK